MDITADYALTKNEAFSAAFLLRRRALIIYWLISLSYAGWLLVVLPSQVYGLGLAACAVVLPVALLYLAVRKSPHVFEQRTVQITAEEFRSTVPSLAVQIPWTATRLRVPENRRVWVVQVGTAVFVVLPKRALSEADQAAFAEFLRSRTQTG